MLEPAGARPVIVEDGAFVGAGTSLLEGVLVGAGAVIGAGRRPDRDLAPVRPRPGPGDHRHGRAPLAVPPGAVVVPGTRALDGSVRRRSTGSRSSVALLVKDRDAGTDARVALEDALR